MTKDSFLKQHLVSMQKFLITFSTLTNIKLFFYAIDQKIIDRQQILTSSQDVFNYLSQVDFPQVTLFPTILDKSLAGFFVLNIAASSKEQALMYQSYLESICQHFSGKNKQVVLLKAIKAQQLQKYLGGLELINSLHSTAPAVTKQSSPLQPNHRHKTNHYLQKALQYIAAHLDRPLTLEEVAHYVYLSPSYLSRLFKQDFAVNFIDYINLQKIALAEEKMLASSVSINKLAKQVGFAQASYFTKIFKKKCGLTPSKYRMKSSNFKKIYTLPRTLNWLNNPSVFAASKEFFAARHLKFQYQTLNDYPFIYAIDNLGNDSQNYGWIYTVDYKQPVAPPSRVSVGQASVIQWIYTKTVF